MRRGKPETVHNLALTRRELGLLALMLLVAVVGAVGLWASRKVYGRGDMEVSTSSDVTPAPLRMDVNTATEPELTMLRGIGPKTAGAIIAYRNEHGPFATLDDLQNVHGIGPATVEAIRPHAMCVPPSGRSD